MIKGFKDFLLRGNVIDLAVAVVIGTAFTAIVSAFTSSIIEPLINAITPPESPGLGFTISVNAAPMTTATARSMTLPRRMNSLKPLIT
jgi:large conductance mechanosensitive channel